MQVLSTRKRKDVEVADIKVQVCLFAFDCLYLNGEMLLQRPLTERRKALLEAVEEKPGELQYALYKVCCHICLPKRSNVTKCTLWDCFVSAAADVVLGGPTGICRRATAGVAASTSVQDVIHLMAS